MNMANIHNNAFIHNTGLNEENSLTHLQDAISPDEENEAVLIEYFKYFDDLGFKNVLRIYNVYIKFKLSEYKCKV